MSCSTSRRGVLAFVLLLICASTAVLGLAPSAAASTTTMSTPGFGYDATLNNAPARLAGRAVVTSAQFGRVTELGGSASPTGVGVATETAGGIADDVVLARGGANTADRFAAGSGVTTDSAGNLHQVSVNSGRTVEEAAQGIPHNQIGVSTAGDVRAAGGSVVRNPLPGNPGHCLVGGLTAETLSELFTPTIKNPCR